MTFILSFLRKQNTTMFKQGDIILFNYPTDDFLTSKKRPCIIIGKSRSTFGSYIVAKITSVLHHDKHAFQLDNTHLSMPLLKPSEVRCDSILTVSEKVILKKLMTLEKEPLQTLCDKIKRNFDVD